MRLTTEKIQSLSQAVLEIYRPLPATELPRHFLSILGNLISTEYTVYNELNPKSGFVSATCDRELPPDLMPLIPVFEKHMLENPLIPILFAKPRARRRHPSQRPHLASRIRTHPTSITNSI